MDNKTLQAMNGKIDVLFGQVADLHGGAYTKAHYAIDLWKSAKVQEQMGLGPMETRHAYKVAYETLRDLGLETGGMIAPYERAAA